MESADDSRLLLLATAPNGCACCFVHRNKMRILPNLTNIYIHDIHQFRWTCQSRRRASPLAVLLRTWVLPILAHTQLGAYQYSCTRSFAVFLLWSQRCHILCNSQFIQHVKLLVKISYFETLLSSPDSCEAIHTFIAW